MKHYFRLLFVSFVLLLLMGLNEKQSEERVSSRPVSVNLAQQFIHAEILPAEAWITSGPNIPPFCCPQVLLYRENNAQREPSNSQAVQTRITCCCGEFKEHLPDLVWKTGQFLHFQTSREVSPQS